MTSEMPKGVEHILFACALVCGHTVMTSEMPKGVEHSCVTATPAPNVIVMTSEMPKGVEHNMAQNFTPCFLSDDL